MNIYFWNQDGARENYCGWWIGAEIGGECVVAHKPDTSPTHAPQCGWNVAHRGAAEAADFVEDKSFAISYLPGPRLFQPLLRPRLTPGRGA